MLKTWIWNGDAFGWDADEIIIRTGSDKTKGREENLIRASFGTVAKGGIKVARTGERKERKRIGGERLRIENGDWKTKAKRKRTLTKVVRYRETRKRT